MNGVREGGWVKTEDDPLEVVEGTKAINDLEDAVVKAGGAVLRYGGFYGAGANDDQVKFVRKRMFPLVGGGTGYFSWVHVDDAGALLRAACPRTTPTDRYWIASDLRPTTAHLGRR